VLIAALSLGVAVAARHAASSVRAAEGGVVDSASETSSPPAGGDASLPASADVEEEGLLEPEIKPINVFHLLLRGGYFMLPILAMSLLVVTFAIERAFGLRRSRVLPPAFVTALGQIGNSPDGFDPRKAYRVCQQFPSAAATVVRSMLLKVGRPHSEVEHAVAEASEREAARLYANVRWINLGTSVAPLLGLLGTVWGMIRCFHDTTQLAPGRNKAEFLAEGIYVALVTTLAGLCVAIPAALIAHYFEGKIQYLFHQVDELVFNLTPQVERFEGRVRFSRQVPPGDGNPRDSVLEPPVQERSAAGK
jgi:biopolymer transport protein ExbB